jgi:GTP pyrophosphokinase
VAEQRDGTRGVAKNGGTKVAEREPVGKAAIKKGRPAKGADLSASERRLLGDLFAIIEEHADESAVVVDREKVEQAFRFACEHHADQLRKSGEEFIVHPVNVAKICAGLRLDTETLCAALLHDTVEDTSASLEHAHDRCDAQAEADREGQGDA